MSRYVNCVRCNKVSPEGSKCVRHRNFTGFYCGFRCLVLDTMLGKEYIVTDELVSEDKEASGFGWTNESE